MYETSKRNYPTQQFLQQYGGEQVSQSSYRESARQALAATKHVDGTLSFKCSTSGYMNPSSKQKVMSFKEKMNQLNSAASQSVRCPSKFGESSSASVTAATSYANRGYETYNRQGGFRPNSNISNSLVESKHQAMPNNYKNFVTDLTRFSQNSVSKDHSPLRASQLAASNPQPPYTKSQKHFMANNGRSSDARSGGLYGAYTVMQDSRKLHGDNNMTRLSYSPLNMHPNQQQQLTSFQNRNARNSSSSRERMFMHQNINLNRFASQQRPKSMQSMQSFKTDRSSPERLVNIVCPPTRSSKRKPSASRIIPGVRSRSDMQRQNQIFNSFTNVDVKERKRRLMKQMSSFANSHGYFMSSFNSNNQQRSLQRLCQTRKVVETPIKSIRNGRMTHSLSKSRSKSRSKSHSRLGRSKSPNDIRKYSLSGNKSNKKLGSRKSLSKWVKTSKTLGSKRSLSNKSSRKSYSRSAKSLNLSANSKSARKSEKSKNRDQRRASKYLRNQKKDSDQQSVNKALNFESVNHRQGKKMSYAQERQLQCIVDEPKIATTKNSGQVTGKFRSLNETMMGQMMHSSKDPVCHQRDTFAAKMESYCKPDYNTRLQTEDDYCETLTASSEESPMRPSQRVQRAAKLTTKAYMEDVCQRVEALQNHGQASIREFGPRKMKSAYQGINKRQGNRLNDLKQQMQESLVETHNLQAKLQNSGMSENHRKGGVSQFNSLVLEFSSNLENMATEMIEATESKRRNRRMKDMISELQQTRQMRSASKSAPASARNMRRRSSLSSSKKKRRLSSAKRSKSKGKSSRRGSVSSRSARSKSSRKSCSTRKKRLTRKRSKSAKKLGKRSKSRGKSSTKKLLRSARSASKSQRSGAKSTRSVASSRGRSRSRKKTIKSVKRNIYKQTNGFRDLDASFGQQTKPSRSRSKSRRSVSRKRSKSKALSKRSLSSKAFSRAKELAKKCQNLVNHKYNVIAKASTAVPKSRKRSMSKKKRLVSKSKSKSRSKSRPKMKKIMRKKTKSRSKSAKKGSKSPVCGSQTKQKGRGSMGQMTPQQNYTPCMTPLHKILRNSIGDADMSALRNSNKMFGSAANPHKKVKIMSQRLHDITQLSSSESDSSYDSEDSLDNEQYLRRQQAFLSPWQKACIRKQMPKKFR